MKVHKGEYVRTSIFVKRDLWKRFDEACRKHKTTTCPVLQALMEALIAGEKKGVVDLAGLGAPNPVVFNLTHVFLGKPRSGHKIDVSGLPVLGKLCHVCGSRAVREFQPGGTPFLEGKCLQCGATWLVHPGRGDLNPGGRST